MLIIMINKRKANKNAEKLKPIRIQQKKTNKNAAKKANKNSPGPGPEPPTPGACRHRVLAAPATPALLSTAPPLPLSQCFALGGICSGSSGGAAAPPLSHKPQSRYQIGN